jgi:DNA-directed RNA polymerase subunit omega
MRRVNEARKFGMRYPSIDLLIDKSGSKYKLVIAAATRAKEIQKNNETLIETSCVKPVGRALEEILAGVVRLTNNKG